MAFETSPRSLSHDDFELDRLDRQRTGFIAAAQTHEFDRAFFFESPRQAPPVLPRLAGIALLEGCEVRCGRQIHIGRDLAIGDLRGNDVHQLRDVGIGPDASQPQKIGVGSGAQKIETSAHHRQGVSLAIEQHVAVLADRVAHPECLGNAADALGDERPNHDQPAVAAAGNDGKLQPREAAG